MKSGREFGLFAPVFPTFLPRGSLPTPVSGYLVSRRGLLYEKVGTIRFPKRREGKEDGRPLDCCSKFDSCER